jgi:DNA-binding transcriptional LysR family regulator
MTSYRHQIGPLSAVFAFEAAARNLQFARAADELGVSQAAVSKQIANLETHLGKKLFHRRHRSVELTTEGVILYQAVHTSLKSMTHAMQEISMTESSPLTVSLSTALSQFWLMPRLSDFTTRHPEIPVRILSQDSHVDLRSNDASISIRFGDGTWPDGEAVALFRATVRPVAARQLLEKYQPKSIEDLLRMPLIDYDTPDSSWVTWRDWREVAGVAHHEFKPVLSFARYQDAVVAARNGQGVMLDWMSGDSDLSMSAGLLAAPGPSVEPTGRFYCVFAPTVDEKSVLFGQWLRSLS